MDDFDDVTPLRPREVPRDLYFFIDKAIVGQIRGK